VVVPVARHGRLLIKYTAVARASAQNGKGAALWISKVRKQSLVVRRTRSALPFCCDVYGHERRSWMPWEERSRRMAEESYSPPLSVWKARIGSLNWVCTYEMKDLIV